MEALDPLDWTAGPFLLLYAACAGVVLLWLLVWKNRLGQHVTGQATGALDVLHLAYLSGGAERAASVALVGLLEAGAARPDRKRRVMRFDPSVPVAAEFAPFRHVSAGEARREQFQAELEPRWRRMHGELAARGLVPSDAAFAAYRARGAALLGIPLVLGVCKVGLGLSRDRPVGILLLLLLVTVIFGALLLAPHPHCNPAGAAVLAAARRDHARAVRAPLPEEMALAFALSGAVVLAGRDYRWALQSSSSSSGGDGGGNGGGDGGGDGGCGGCSA